MRCDDLRCLRLRDGIGWPLIALPFFFCHGQMVDLSFSAVASIDAIEFLATVPRLRSLKLTHTPLAGQLKE